MDTAAESSVQTRNITLPPQFARVGSILDNPIRQLHRPVEDAQLMESFAIWGVTRHVAARSDTSRVLVVPKRIKVPDDGTEVLIVPDLDAFRASGSMARWLTPISSTIANACDSEPSRYVPRTATRGGGKSPSGANDGRAARSSTPACARRKSAHCTPRWRTGR